MAADKTDKTLNLASELVSAADQLISAFEQFVALLDEREGAGLDFADPAFVEKLEASALKHATPDLLNNAIGSGVAIYTAMKQGGTLSAFTDDAFQALRP